LFHLIYLEKYSFNTGIICFFLERTLHILEIFQVISLSKAFVNTSLSSSSQNIPVAFSSIISTTQNIIKSSFDSDFISFRAFTIPSSLFSE